MLITVNRKWYTDSSTIGEMTIDTFPDFHCFTLEPPYKDDGSKPRAVPAGIYNVIIRYSDKHHMNVPGLENVPDFQDVEIHPGNFPKDTLGCTLVGQTRDVDFIGASRPVFTVVFNKISTALQNKESVQITYINNR